MRIRAKAVAATAGGALTSAPGPRVSPSELAELPAPAARYLRFALGADQRRVLHARVVHEGELQTSPGEWRTFTSVQHIAVRPPGFVWDASIRVWPLVSVHVRDSYVDGTGRMRASALAVWTMMDRHGSPELAQAALQRWLAEAVWLPTALLPAAGVRWDAIDDRSARATIVDHGITASLAFHFAPSGAVERCDGERYQDTSEGATLTPWEGRFDSYARLDGMMIPLRGEAAWLGARGRAAYWRGRITAIDYDFG